MRSARHASTTAVLDYSSLVEQSQLLVCAAIVDRLTFGNNIIETGTRSYRLAHTRAQRAAG